MDENESFDEFYTKLKDIVNSTFNLGERILEPQIVRNILRSLSERFHAKITIIEESKDLDSIPLIELIGNLQTYKQGLARVGKGGKGKNMALKTKNDDIDESPNDEDTKLKSYITKKFKKFIKNANVKASDKDRKQSTFSQFKSQDKDERIQGCWSRQQCSYWTKELWVSRIWTHEARVSPICQINWQKQIPSCHLE